VYRLLHQILLYHLHISSTWIHEIQDRSSNPPAIPVYTRDSISFQEHGMDLSTLASASTHAYPQRLECLCAPSSTRLILRPDTPAVKPRSGVCLILGHVAARLV
jgi:hypothetical protein